MPGSDERGASSRGRDDIGTGEPKAGRGSTPLWMVVLLGVLFYWGQLYLDENAAGFDGRVFEPFRSFAEVDALQPKDPAALLAAKGKTIYEARCMACHQATGLGQAPLFPPLAGSEWVNTPGASRMIRIATHGLLGPISIKGQEFNNVMPPGLTEGLTDEELAAVLTYVRNSWGNKAPAVKAEVVKSVRGKITGRSQSQSWTAKELQSVPDSE